MSKPHELPLESPYLSPEQLKTLERIAQENGAALTDLVLWAVDALISEEARQDNQLSLPRHSHAKPQGRKEEA